jgi:hypothetical protein
MCCVLPLKAITQLFNVIPDIKVSSLCAVIALSGYTQHIDYLLLYLNHIKELSYCFKWLYTAHRLLTFVSGITLNS